MELNSSISAVITGGASGLGEATARALRAKGVKVALLDINIDAAAPTSPWTGQPSTVAARDREAVTDRRSARSSPQ